MSRATIRPRRKAEADKAYQAFVQDGFPVTFAGRPETLQIATETDRSNWLIFKGAVDDALAAGAKPDDPMPFPLRCTSNRSYTVTYGEALQIVAGMRTWGYAAQINCWRLKDAIEAAADNAALNAIDLTEGWP